MALGALRVGPVIVLLGVALAAGSWAAWWRSDPPPLSAKQGQQPQGSTQLSGHPSGTMLQFRSQGGGALLLSTNTEGDLKHWSGDVAQLPLEPDHRRAERLLAIPSAMQWRHPLPGLPAAMVVRTAELDATGNHGPQRLFTYVTADHGDLPIVSLVLAEEDLFDPDRGIYVPGNAALDPPEEIMKRFLQDGRWWKYPGNYHYRGKAWERNGLLQIADGRGAEVLHSPVRVRINGQMTRGFPQHALRLLFDDPLQVPLFPDGEGVGAKALVLRAAGNDQVKAMMRDAVLQDLCAVLPFDVSRSNTCVVYINGAYWGVHHLRQRLDEKELARRYSVSAKQVAIAEIRMRKFVGEVQDRQDLEALVKRFKEWDGKDGRAFLALDQELDVDGFLHYMAAMIVLGNRDWPGDNVKLWRYTGTKGAGKPLDGRWYFTMGDVDLGFGANHPASADLYEPFRRADSPIVVMFTALMRSPELATLFRHRLVELVEGPLSTERMVEHIDRRIALMAPEMERHTARWRKPVNFAAWHAHAQVMRRYAQQRPAEVMRQVKELQPR